MRKLKYILLLIVLFVLCCGFRTTDTLVFDDAKLLTGYEESLTQKAKEVSDKLKMQVVIVTTNTTNGMSTGDYADHFQYEKGLGYTKKDADAIVFCIDMENRKIYISTSGEAISQVTDDEVDELLSRCKTYATDGDYQKCCNQFLSDIVSYASNDEYDDSIDGYFDEETGKFIIKEPTYLQRVFDPFTIMVAVIIGLIVATVSTLVNFFSSRSHMTVDANTYQKGKFKMKQKSDRFMHQTVTKRKIEKNDSSGSDSSSHHTDDSGSHGGGGTSF